MTVYKVQCRLLGIETYYTQLGIHCFDGRSSQKLVTQLKCDSATTQSPYPHSAIEAFAALQLLLHIYPFQYLDMASHCCCPESFEAFLASPSLSISV